MTIFSDPGQPALSQVKPLNRNYRKTQPRIQSGAAKQQITAVVNGVERRYPLSVCSDGRIYFGLIRHKLTAGGVNDLGQRVLKGGRYTILVDNAIYEKLAGMAKALAGGVA